MSKFVILLVLAAISVAAFVVLRQQQIDLDTLRGHVDALAGWRESIAAPFAMGFFAAYVLVTALSLPLAVWMALAAGALFGFWQGLLIVSFASSLGATLFLRPGISCGTGSASGLDRERIQWTKALRGTAPSTCSHCA